MAQPPGYTPTVNFQEEETNQVSGRSTLRTPALDVEFANLKATLDVALTNLALLQRDDGELVDGIVKTHTLSNTVLQLLTSAAYTIRGVWITATAYALGDIVVDTTIPYVCMEAHTSGVFATDLAADKWASLRAGTAASIIFASTPNLAAVDVQQAIEEVDSDLRPGVNLYLHQNFGGL
jgi:F420-0:gamma-glutamyl ligase-like protein